MKKVFTLKLILSILTISTVLVFASMLLQARRDVIKSVEKMQGNIKSTLQFKAVALRNARWNMQRSLFVPQKRASVKDYYGAMLFGLETNYFIAIKRTGSTVIEIRNGNYSDQHSRVWIHNWDDIVAEGARLYYRPCKVDQAHYLCLIDTPNFYSAISNEDSIIGLITISRDEIQASARLPDIRKENVFSKNNFTISLTSNDNGEEASSRYNYLSKTMTIDDGFNVRAEVSINEFITKWLIFSTSLSLIILGLIHIALTIIATYVNHKTEMTRLILNDENFEEVQQLVRGVIHDIRGPLTALLSLARTENNIDRRQMLDLLIKRMRSVVSDLEGKGKIGTQGQQSMLPIDMVLSLAVKEKQSAIGDKIKILYVAPNIRMWAKGDFSELMRVFSNILTNAIQASHEGAVIRVEISEIKNKLVITIEDQGIGIPEDVMGRLFNYGATFGKKEGSGFGLYHARRTLEALGGTINIKSKRHEGTEVAIELPQQQNPVWNLDRLKIDHVNKIVVVDDEEINLQMWAQRLSNIGIELCYFSHPRFVPEDLLKRKDILFVIDNNFGSERDLGIEFIQSAGIEKALLFTSDWWVAELQAKCDRTQAKILGKDLLDFYKIG